MEIEIAPATQEECSEQQELNDIDDNTAANPALEEDENTNISGGAVEMLQEHVYSNDDEEGNVEMAPEPNIDENTILLPVAGENGFNGDDPAIADLLQEEEDVTDPMESIVRPDSRVNEKVISQVPKKRRIPVPVNYDEDEESPDKDSEKKLKRRGRKPGTKVINGQVIQPDGEQSMTSVKSTPKTIVKATPSSSKSAKSAKGESSSQVNENQCRVCTSSKELVNIFKKEFQKTYAEKLMTICPTVSIQRKDFLPQFICNICVSSVNAAFALKGQCERTDVEMRTILENSVKKARKIPNYVPPDSDPDDVPDAPQDQDFKLSDATPPSADDTDSDYTKPLIKRRTRRGSRKSLKATPPKAAASSPEKKPKVKKEKESPVKKVIKPDPDLNSSKASDGDVDGPAPAAGDFSSGSEEDYSPPKKRRARGKKTRASDEVGFSCRICHETLGSREELKEHKKAAHSNFECELCGRKFKMQSSLKTHMDKHTNTGILKCEPCDKHFPNKTERRRHMMEVHRDMAAQFSCEKCKRAFTSELRLQKHTEANCPGFDTSQKRRGDLESLSMGKDLFKCVAPLTTTYWSDSFSD